MPSTLLPMEIDTSRSALEFVHRLLGRSPADQPPLEDLLGLTQDIALAVAREAQDSGMAPPSPEDAVRSAIAARFWVPFYRPLL